MLRRQTAHSDTRSRQLCAHMRTACEVLRERGSGCSLCAARLLCARQRGSKHLFLVTDGRILVSLTALLM